VLVSVLRVTAAAVAEGLESLAKQKLNWDPVQLSAGLPLLGDPLNSQDGLVSQEQCNNLVEAGFTNYLKVRATTGHTPRIVPGCVKRLLLCCVLYT
jgi:hypothetical protein